MQRRGRQILALVFLALSFGPAFPPAALPLFASALPPSGGAERMMFDSAPAALSPHPQDGTVKYFDRRGEPITLARWQELIRDHKYCALSETETTTQSLVTSWIGVQSDVEASLKTFVTIYEEQDKKGEWQTVTQIWHATEAGALTEHQRQLKIRFPNLRRGRA
jgi:hypothetical protein